MKTLIVEDDPTSRLLLEQFLKPYGEIHIAVNGKEAVKAVKKAITCRRPYDLICLDIMMPEMDGQTALQRIRKLEEKTAFFSLKGVKIIMTTVLDDMKNFNEAYRSLCDGYLVKPIEKTKLFANLRLLKLIS